MKNILYKLLLIITILNFNSCVHAQLYNNLETLFNSEELIVYGTDSIYNYLLEEPILTEGDIGVLNNTITKSSKNKFFITLFVNSNKFYIHNEGEVIYKGEGGLDSLSGSHYYTDDFKEINGNFKNGKLEGLYTIENKKTGKKTEKEYIKGKLSGSLIMYDTSGQITYFCQYRNGEKHGLEYQLYDNQMLRFFNYYENGVMADGVYYMFDGDGKPLIKEEWKGGKVKD